jgi:hypothetical protein
MVIAKSVNRGMKDAVFTNVNGVFKIKIACDPDLKLPLIFVRLA